MFQKILKTSKRWAGTIIHNTLIDNTLRQEVIDYKSFVLMLSIFLKIAAQQKLHMCYE